ncbi:hypothetical protein R3P38DRAFT_3295192 [Favolaschia claudopus]|uniref:Maturase K n=1 Tax=Favolaschia claudopus TaxID=2862362 RepID=A0AAV9ZCL9_9AGAR
MAVAASTPVSSVDDTVEVDIDLQSTAETPSARGPSVDGAFSSPTLYTPLPKFITSSNIVREMFKLYWLLYDSFPYIRISLRFANNTTRSCFTYRPPSQHDSHPMSRGTRIRSLRMKEDPYGKRLQYSSSVRLSSTPRRGYGTNINSDRGAADDLLGMIEVDLDEIIDDTNSKNKTRSHKDSNNKLPPLLLANIFIEIIHVLEVLRRVAGRATRWPYRFIKLQLLHAHN